MYPPPPSPICLGAVSGWLTPWQLGPPCSGDLILEAREPIGLGLEELAVRSCGCAQQQRVQFICYRKKKNNHDLKNKKVIVLLEAVLFNFNIIMN